MTWRSKLVAMDFHPDLQTDLIFQARSTLYGEQFHVTIVYQLLPDVFSLGMLCVSVLLPLSGLLSWGVAKWVR